jgi:hypothetical protein
VKTIAKRNKLAYHWAPHDCEGCHGKTGLARRLGVSETVVRRMLNPKHNTKPEKIQAALAALGKRIVVTFEDATPLIRDLTAE